MAKWKTISSKVVYKNPWITVKEDNVIRPDGKEGLFGVIDTNPSVYIVALTSNDEVILVKHHRYTIQTETLEIPAGGSDGEDFLKAAQRELQEETGMIANEWKYISETIVFPGVGTEIMHTFLAKGLTQTNNHKQQEDLIIETVTVPFEKAFSLIKSGEIFDSQSITALIQASFYLGYSFKK